jgi:hypothetical protein
MSVLDTLLAKRGSSKLTEPRFSVTGKSLRREGVPACAEWQRINALPRRVWSEEPDLDETVELLTQWLKTPTGTQRLWSIQAIALREIADTKGLVGGIRVGGGKALTALLAPTVLELKRPMLFVPAKSIRSGKCDMAYREARQHWRVATNLQFVSYEMLQTLRFADILDKYRPDGIIADEAHKWRSNDSARHARVERFRESLIEPVPFILLSGTLMASHTVKDVAKLCEWALGSGSPLPRNWKSQKDWADALEVRAAETTPRMQPGALARWCDDQEPSLDNVRRAYGRRYTQTAGVVVSSGDSIGQSLIIETKVNNDYNDAIEKAFAGLRADPPQAPDGWIIVDAPVVWSTAQQLALGFYYKCDPRPPEAWTIARQNWAGYCRERIKVGDIDTELQVANECRSLAENAHRSWLEWIKIRHTFVPNVVPVWLDDNRIQQAAAWLKKHKGLCWTQFRAFGERLSEVAQVPFFSADASDRDGHSILDYPGGPAIVSIAACSEDLNLQDRWHANLFVAPPSSGQHLEQALARTHRFGQRSDEVTCQLWVGCLENEEAIVNARAKEAAVALSSLDDARKLLVADWVVEPVRRNKNARWHRK